MVGGSVIRTSRSFASFPQLQAVAPLASLRVFVAGETTALIDLREEAMAAIDESVDRVVASRALVVTPFARIGLMTYGATDAIHRRHSPV